MRSPRSHSLSDERPEHPRARAAGFAPRSFRVPASASRLRWVREHVDESAAAFGFGSEDRHRWVVAVNEAATNAIKHGRPYHDGMIVVRTVACGNTLVCSICDGGQFVSAPADPDLLAERGRGFKLMALFTDKTEVSTGADGTTVRLQKRRPGATPERV